MNIQYGVSTWLWTSPFKTDAIEPLFKKVADLGFDAIEIANKLTVGQEYTSDSSFLCFITTRYFRNYWKYLPKP